MIHNNEMLFFFKASCTSAAYKQISSTTQNGNQSQFHQRYADAVYNLNKRLAVEIRWLTYTNFYEQTKLNYEM